MNENIIITLCLISQCFQIAEMTIIPIGSLIQTHLQPSSQVVENVLNL